MVPEADVDDAAVNERSETNACVCRRVKARGGMRGEGLWLGSIECSALNYLLAGHQTIPPEIGIFLDQTGRLHPDVCGFVSEAF